jgi:hypothetical protein
MIHFTALNCQQQKSSGAERVCQADKRSGICIYEPDEEPGVEA